ncbi:MAG: BMP family ABC transporter substrate-binding protein [Archangiaceae bacterium]|nr:BMP family ABC transporter substrate-binding protein [Archangiaceae bacterium]
MTRALALCLTLVSVGSCKKSDEGGGAKPGEKPAEKTIQVGLVTDVGGRGDESFNDAALRGLELWAAGSKLVDGKYVPAEKRDLEASIPADLASMVTRLPVKPMVLQSKAQEDYQPNLQLLVDKGCDLTVGVGFMLENAVEAAAKEYPKARFLLIDSPILDANGNPQSLPNVRTMVFREHEGSFLVGALAGLLAKEKVGFVGGMEIPLIKKFEAGFRAGVKTTNPKAEVLVSYTGSFDKVAAGKQVGQDFMAKGVEIVFQAAGSDGLGVIQAVKEARAAGKNVYAIGVDSDQYRVAPDVILTSMVKRVDLAVYFAAKDLVNGNFIAADGDLGLKENGVAYAPIRLAVPGKDAAVAKVEALRKLIVDGKLRVPANLGDLEAFTPPAL